ncbi:MAG: phosphotransferase, partial [Anaerolineales bacterium]|nr:phosphotransferase [Anaerolineales bacterium]
MADVSISTATAFLATHFDSPIADVQLVGAGAWSRCYGFQLGNDDLVIRFGGYREDFAKDQLAYRYHSAALPIPELLEIGDYEDGFYAISRRAYGQPLEAVTPEEWAKLIPALVDGLEALRTADLANTTGFGGWDGQGQTHSASWSAELLTVGIDWPEQRAHGWLKRLADGSPAGHATFRWGYELLRQIASDDVPRCLLHCDLINRNVLVADDHLTAVFDWGCGRYGDHLYELA